MKSFDEWFEEKYSNSLMSNSKLLLTKARLKLAWQAAQEVQRDSDAKCYVNNRFASVGVIERSIRNNKHIA